MPSHLLCYVDGHCASSAPILLAQSDNHQLLSRSILLFYWFYEQEFR